MEKQEVVVNIYDLDLGLVEEIQKCKRPLSSEELANMQPSETYSAEDYFVHVLPKNREQTNLMLNTDVPLVDVELEPPRGDEICVNVQWGIETVKDPKGNIIRFQPRIVELCIRPLFNL